METFTPFLIPDRDPRHLDRRVWGGPRLARAYGVDVGPGDVPVGEAWELSSLDSHPSFVGGRPLSERLGGPLPFLVKQLDTAAPLSVQVHPADGDEGPGKSGKEEAWIILASAPGAWIRAGLAAGVDPQTFLDLAARAPTDRAASAALLDAMEALPTEPGTSVLLPGGTPHALGPGLLLAEIQQPVDRTFRLYDHGRGRPLHLAEAARVLRAEARARVWRPGGAEPLDLRGDHVRLAAADGGAHPGGWPALVVPVRGEVRLESPEGPRPLPPGRLALWRGPEGALRPDPEGLAVLAWVTDSGG